MPDRLVNAAMTACSPHPSLRNNNTERSAMCYTAEPVHNPAVCMGTTAGPAARTDTVPRFAIAGPCDHAFSR